jgi:tetratricopeptide (TPR) repeat protein
MIMRLLLCLLLAGGLAAPAQQQIAPAPAQPIQFSDNPDFKIAGVTDWTAVGGHGSDATLRTSEDLARETAALKARNSSDIPISSADAELEGHLRAALAAAPGTYSANYNLGSYFVRTQQYERAIPFLKTASQLAETSGDSDYQLALACRGLGDLKQAKQHIDLALARADSADLHRLAGDIDEALGDPLAAVQQDERAVRLDPSEANYFAWGSELLLHRAVWQAAQVFSAGAKTHPRSARLLTGWGAALFAGDLYEDAAQRLCEAANLDPDNQNTYIFMGKVDAAAPGSLPCIEEKLEYFARQQPDRSVAKYLYAMALLKHGGPDRGVAETLLKKAVALDPKNADADMQLGSLAFAGKDYAGAIRLYTQAADADPRLPEPHYRLGVAYDRVGEKQKANQQFGIHASLEKEQADAVEQQRREIKQFLVVLQAQH